MYKLKYSGKIKKDLKVCQKRNVDFSLFEQILNKLMVSEPLDPKNKDHYLSGNYSGYRECHITPNWLLV